MYSFTAINGRLCGDPEVRYTQSQKPVCSLCVAVDDGFGEKKTTVFYNCVVWGEKGEFVSKHFAKGDGIVLSGKMTTRKWTDKNGNNRLEWELTANNVDFPVGKKETKAVDVQYSDPMDADEGELPFM